MYKCSGQRHLQIYLLKQYFTHSCQNENIEILNRPGFRVNLSSQVPADSKRREGKKLRSLRDNPKKGLVPGCVYWILFLIDIQFIKGNLFPTISPMSCDTDDVSFGQHL